MDLYRRGSHFNVTSKLKLFVERRLFIIGGEEYIFVSHIESYRYISSNKDCTATPFQVLEVASMVTLPVEKVKKPTDIVERFINDNRERWLERLGKAPRNI